MKKICLFLLLALGAWSCSEDRLSVYSGEGNSIYFSRVNDTYLDTVNFSFAMHLTSDTTISFKVEALGDMTDYDRTFKVALDERSTATAGKHFDVLEAEYILPAKSRYATIPLRIHRTDDLYDTIVSVTLNLIPNENFHQLVVERESKNEDVNVIRKTLIFTSITMKPDVWMDNFVGYFSVAKFNLANSLLNIEPLDWYEKKVTIGELVGVGTFMTNYLNDRINTGNPADAIKDPDPKSERGYMTFKNVNIPAHYPDAR